jgi:hypothetical protein
MKDILLFIILTYGSTTTSKSGINTFLKTRKQKVARCWWLTPIILATQEAEIRRITVQSQPLANSSQDPISKKPIIKKG